MSVEVFFVPNTGAEPLTAERLIAALHDVALRAARSDDGDLLWLEFDGFESRLLTSATSGPLALITLQFLGNIDHEADLIERIEGALRANGYVNGEELYGDAEA